MSFSPVPLYLFRNLTDISPEFLGEIGVKLLMLDLDNTIAAYSEQSLAKSIALWSERVVGCGVRLFIVSNNARNKRVETFAKALSVGYAAGASKPSPKVVLRTIEEFGFKQDESALVGDQIFADALAANRAGIISIIVRPRRFTNPLLVIRYALEMPFRAMCGNKMFR
ncbi:MAG: YqeG family HAD IIIA-type phosphatase [Oscillospiraceae bacterium]|nr:YqeG family HAD IIIA-type phosphatase [Oscillospiraceae bacterium]